MTEEEILKKMKEDEFKREIVREIINVLRTEFMSTRNVIHTLICVVAGGFIIIFMHLYFILF